MTDAPSASTTGGALIAFIESAARHGDLPKPLAANWRTACVKVLGTQEGWEELDIASLDLDAFLVQFDNLRRNEYKEDSRAAYKSRFRSAVDTFLRRSRGEAWRPTPARRAGPPERRTPGSVVPSGPLPSIPEQALSVETIVYTVPLRDGRRATLHLPERLLREDATRVANFLSAIAFEDQLTLPATS